MVTSIEFRIINRTLNIVEQLDGYGSLTRSEPLSDSDLSRMIRNGHIYPDSTILSRTNVNGEEQKLGKAIDVFPHEFEHAQLNRMVPPPLEMSMI
jgi:hypothetical protein